MAHDVFISYANTDKVIADALCAGLEGRGTRCWIAPRDVPPGAEWAGSIVEAIGRSKVLVLVFSAASNGSQHVMREVERAVHKGLVIIPFRTEAITPSKSLEYFVSSCHWLDAMTPPLEANIRRLVDRVSRFLLNDTTSEDRGGAKVITSTALASPSERLPGTMAKSSNFGF